VRDTIGNLAWPIFGVPWIEPAQPIHGDGQTNAT